MAERRPLVNVSGRTQELPGGDSVPPAFAAGVSRAASFVLSAADHSQPQWCSGTITATLPGSAAVGAGYVAWIVNVGSAVVTIAAAGVDLIVTAPQVRVHPGRSLQLVCSGAGWYVGSGAVDTSFRVRLSADTDLGSDQIVRLNLDTVVYDRQGWWSTSLYRFTAQIPGVYAFNVYFSPGGLSDTHPSAMLYRNGVADSVFSQLSSTHNGFIPGAGGARHTLLNAGDYVELRVQLIGDFPYTARAGAIFAGALVA